MTERISLSKDWYDRGVQLLNEYELSLEARLLFEAYIYLWISLTVASKEYCANNKKVFNNLYGHKTTDKDEIIYWAVEYGESRILSMLKENKSIIFELCERRGSEMESPIMDVENEIIKNYHVDFIKYWNNEMKYPNTRRMITTYIHILNRVRNNLFHGGKSFKLEGDIELLKLTCPLLEKTTKLCLNC